MTSVHQLLRTRIVSWDDPRLSRVVVLRLETRPGLSWSDVTSCEGELKDGRRCRVRLPFAQLPKGLETITILRYAQAEGVFAKGLGVFAAITFRSTDLDCKSKAASCL
ncbi:hypothetical protein AMYX_14030 [Anaeromyxobacter diazotrophicus]|uniref:Uncharacterized protein n=1 Tax=Anaeromyxobacter diazotrophicus TaxID=2590199 RepID=A0A7I9VJT5_9BACT|nr:hypothetical protein AMYX_14030 [Anaeromyxobacter diazotrophicus]